MNGIVPRVIFSIAFSGIRFAGQVFKVSLQRKEYPMENDYR
jgi:hypothetical protein